MVRAKPVFGSWVMLSFDRRANRIRISQNLRARRAFNEK
jgi:hypothetical protein